MTLVAVPHRPHHARPALTGAVVIVAVVALYLGALGLALAACAVMSVGVATSRSRRAERYRERRRLMRARARREATRERELRASNALRQQQYRELRDLVLAIERSDPREAQRLELQDLLDYYAQLSAGHQRCLDALRAASGSDGCPVAPVLDRPRARDRHGVQSRRMRHRDECTARLERIADELDATDELIRLVSQRVACAPLEALLDREIERRLGDLDDVDAALGQISA